MIFAGDCAGRHDRHFANNTWPRYRRLAGNHGASSNGDISAPYRELCLSGFLRRKADKVWANSQLQLRLLIILHTNFLDQLQLRLQPVDVLLFRSQD